MSSASGCSAACGRGTTATDPVLTITERLRKEGMVGKFVEFFGDGLVNLPLADRATAPPRHRATAPPSPAAYERNRG